MYMRRKSAKYPLMEALLLFTFCTREVNFFMQIAPSFGRRSSIFLPGNGSANPIVPRTGPIMTRSFLLAICLCLGTLSTASAEMGPQLKIGELVLKLNGSGVRTKTLVQVYEAGLYLLKPNTDAPTILAADELMAIRIKITSGFVSQSTLVSSLKEGIATSTKDNPAAYARETEQLQQLLQDAVNKNDIYDFVYVPQKGINVLKNAKVLGVIPGLEFKKAFFGIWLSDSPVDKSLRKGLLAGKGGSD